MQIRAASLKSNISQANDKSLRSPSTGVCTYNEAQGPPWHSMPPTRNQCPVSTVGFLSERRWRGAHT